MAAYVFAFEKDANAKPWQREKLIVGRYFVA
jgi:hypothetical protein